MENESNTRKHTRVQATRDMMKKDEEKKRKEEKDKLKKQQKEERKQQWQKEQAQKEKEQTEKAKRVENNPYSVFAEKEEEEVMTMILWVSQSHPPVITSQKAHCHDYH